MDSLAAQAFVFFLGGFETSSTTMTFCLYELSLHQDIQDRLREEIDNVLQKHDGKLTYEGIQEMEYLDKVVSGKTRFFNYIQNILKTGHISHHDADIIKLLSLLWSNLHLIICRKNNTNFSYYSLFGSMRYNFVKNI
jgi:hypothetical protein